MEAKRLKGFRNTNEELIKDGLVTSSGGSAYSLENFSEKDVSLDRIAISLANQCRYNGGVSNINGRHLYYSVAQHCVLGAEALLIMGRVKEAMQFLFHDAAETWIGDIPTPIKKKYGGEIKTFEEGIEEIVFKVFGIDYPFSKDIKLIDLNMCELEMSTLLAGDDDVLMDCWLPEEAAARFKRTHVRLKHMLKFDKKELKTQPLTHFA